MVWHWIYSTLWSSLQNHKSFVWICLNDSLLRGPVQVQCCCKQTAVILRHQNKHYDNDSTVASPCCSESIRRKPILLFENLAFHDAMIRPQRSSTRSWSLVTTRVSPHHLLTISAASYETLHPNVHSNNQSGFHTMAQALMYFPLISNRFHYQLDVYLFHSSWGPLWWKILHWSSGRFLSLSYKKMFRHLQQFHLCVVR